MAGVACLHVVDTIAGGSAATCWHPCAGAHSDLVDDVWLSHGLAGDVRFTRLADSVPSSRAGVSSTQPLPVRCTRNRCAQACWFHSFHCAFLRTCDCIIGATRPKAFTGRLPAACRMEQHGATQRSSGHSKAPHWGSLAAQSALTAVVIRLSSSDSRQTASPLFPHFRATPDTMPALLQVTAAPCTNQVSCGCNSGNALGGRLSSGAGDSLHHPLTPPRSRCSVSSRLVAGHACIAWFTPPCLAT